MTIIAITGKKSCTMRVRGDRHACATITMAPPRSVIGARSDTKWQRTAKLASVARELNSNTSVAPSVGSWRGVARAVRALVTRVGSGAGRPRMLGSGIGSEMSGLRRRRIAGAASLVPRTDRSGAAHRTPFRRRCGTVPGLRALRDVAVEDGRIFFFDDIYGYGSLLASALDNRYIRRTADGGAGAADRAGGGGGRTRIDRRVPAERASASRGRPAPRPAGVSTEPVAVAPVGRSRDSAQGL